MLWPDIAGRSLTQRFKNVIYKLRSVLPDDTIRYEGERYRFNPDQDYVYDVEAFQAYLGLADDPETSASQIAALQAAVDIYRGPF